MKAALIFALLCIAVSLSFADDTLECYQCTPVTQECEVDKAEQIKCGSPKTSRCTKQVKKGSKDETKAMRKCDVPDKNGNIKCGDGYECYHCDSDLCNAAAVTKFTWMSLAGAFVTALYMY